MIDWKAIDREPAPAGKQILLYGMWPGVWGYSNDTWGMVLGSHQTVAVNGQITSDKWYGTDRMHHGPFKPHFWAEVQPPDIRKAP